MGEGINLALDLLESRKQEYKDKGVDYYQPWLVIMTDGEPNGEAGFLHLSTIEKCNLLALPLTSSKRIIRRYDEILLLLQQKHDLATIAQHIHLKEKYTQRYVDKLCALNFVTKDEDKYLTCISL